MSNEDTSELNAPVPGDRHLAFGSPAGDQVLFTLWTAPTLLVRRLCRKLLYDIRPGLTQTLLHYLLDFQKSRLRVGGRPLREAAKNLLQQGLPSPVPSLRSHADSPQALNGLSPTPNLGRPVARIMASRTPRHIDHLTVPEIACYAGVLGR